MTPGFQRVDELGWKDDERGRDPSFIQFSFSFLNITLILVSFDSQSHPHHSSPTLIHLSSCLILSFFIPPLRSFYFPSHLSLSLTIYSFKLSHFPSISLCQVPSPIGFFYSSNLIFHPQGKWFSNFFRWWTRSTEIGDHFKLKNWGKPPAT